MPLVLDPIQSGYNLSKINDNFQRIEDTWDEKLDRVNSGSFYNQMDQALDMNSNEIINTRVSDDPTSLVTKEYVDALFNAIDGAEGVVPIIEPRQQGDGVTILFNSPATGQAPAASFFIQIDGITQRPITDFNATGAGKIQFTEAPPLFSDVDITWFEPAVIGEGDVSNKSVTATTSGNTKVLADWMDVVEIGDGSNKTVISTGSTTPRTLADRFSDIVNIKDFGAVGDGVVDDTVAIQAACDSVTTGCIYVPAGSYRISAQITVPPGLSLQGDGQRASYINSYITDPNTAALYTDATSLGTNGHISWGGLGIISYTLEGIGLFIKDLGYGSFEDINTENFRLHWSLNSVLSSRFSSVRGRFGPTGAVGMQAINSGTSNPNALNFFNSSFGALGGGGMNIINPANLVFMGGSIEACGISGPTGYGIRMENPGGQGAAAFLISGVYFEGNNGGSDIGLIMNNTTVPVSGVVTGCSFNRLDDSNFTDHNITVTKVLPTDARAAVAVTGCGFQSFNTYVPSAARQYIWIDGDSTSEVNIETVANMYGDAIEAPSRLKSQSGVNFNQNQPIEAYKVGDGGMVRVTPAHPNPLIENPVGMAEGQVITIVIRNVFANYTSLAFGTQYKFTTLPVAPTLNHSIVYTFVRMDANNVVEVSRSGEIPTPT